MNVGQHGRDELPDRPLSRDLSRQHDSRARPAPPVSVWNAEPAAGEIIGVVLVLIALASAIVVWSRFGDAGGFVRLLWFLLGLAAAGATTAIIVLIARLRTIRYSLTPSELAISAVGLRIEMPLDDIASVVFRPRDMIDIQGFERYWPGFYDSLRPTSEGYWRSIATTPPNERVRIRLRNGLTIAISPQRPVLFVEALEAFRRGGRGERLWEPSGVGELPVQTATPPVEPPAIEPVREDRPGERRTAILSPRRWKRPVAVQIFQERIVRGDAVASNILALNLIALIVLITITSWRGDAINSPVPVHWNADGEPTWFVRPSGFWVFEGIWIYPVTAGAILAVNAALATLAVTGGHVAEARLLLSAALVATLLLLVGLWHTTGAALPVLG